MLSRNRLFIYIIALIQLKGAMQLNKYQKRTIYISTGVLVFFLLLSILMNKWGFFVWSLPPIFINIMIAFFVKENKHIQEFNQKYADKVGTRKK